MSHSFLKVGIEPTTVAFQSNSTQLETLKKNAYNNNTSFEFISCIV